MKLLIIRVAFAILFLAPLSVLTQNFGGFKPSKDWNQLNTERYRIIFSPENEIQARKTAAIIETQYRLNKNIGENRDKINIVIQNSTTQANGYVGLGPFVSEFFLTPFPDNFTLGSLPWHYTLGIHEYQHVLQFSNSKRGITKLANRLGGENFWGDMQALSIPNWFFEGDAVRAETQYSMQGRGRNPTFHNAFRRYAQQSNFPSYEKLRNGSIRDYLPNHYQFGYLMAAYGKENYGEDFWPTVLEQSAKYKGVFYPFSQALKRSSGLNSTKFYNSTILSFQEDWRNTSNHFGDTIFKPKKHEVTNYEFPKVDTDSSLYYYKETYDNIGAIYQLKNGVEKKIKELGIRSNNYFDVFDGKLLSTQTYFNKRWGWVDYENIILYDPTSKKIKKITKNGKYFHPSFSPKGDKVVALSVAPNHSFNLEIISIADTSVKKIIPNEKNYYYSYPIWSDEQTIVCTTRDSIGQLSLTEVDLKTGVHKLLVTTYHLMGKPSVKNKKIYFAASFSGIDNIYEWDNGIINQLTQKGSGRYQVAVSLNSDSLYFTNFSLHGKLLIKSSLELINKDFKVKPLSEIKPYKKNFFNRDSIVSPNLMVDSIKSTKYSKFTNLINVHSWGVTADDPLYGLHLESENILNTLDLNVAYKYNRNESTSGIYGNIDYGQYFLHLNGRFSSSKRLIERIEAPNVHYTENLSAIGISLPLNYSSNLFSRRLRLSSALEYSKINFDASKFADVNLLATSIQALYSQQKIKARKNIFTHFGIFSRIRERKGLNENNFQLLLQNSISLKGLFQNHNLIIDADAQFENGSSAIGFSNLFNYARGFQSFRFAELYKVGTNYHFPILYPDIGTSGLIYIYRIRGNLFYDYSIAPIANRNFNSTGGEVILDLKLIRLLSLSIGVRYTQILSQRALSKTNSNSYLEIFIPINRF